MPQERKGRNGGTLKSQSKGDPPLNPNGRPKKLPELDDLMDDLFGGENGEVEDSGTKEIFDKLREKAKKGDTRAAEIILAYCYGKPKQVVEQTGKGGGPIQVSTRIDRLSEQEADALLELLEKVKE